MARRTAAVEHRRRAVAGRLVRLGAILEIIGYISPQLVSLIALILLALPFSVLVLAGFLIRNGVQMVRREGRSLGNLLSLLAGTGLLVLPVVAFLLASTLHPVGIGVAALAFFVSAQAGLSFLAFLVFTIAYARRPPRPGADAVVVLGAGLINGKVSPVLASRLDRGLRVRESQGSAPLIPSGGQGPDEPRPEAAAMAEYLADHGVPQEQIIPELRSRTTEENLRFSRALADQSPPAGAAPGHLVVATNEYHVPRTALLSRRIGVDADVVGGTTAGYYVPSAYLREFVAVMSMHRRTQILLAVPGLVLSLGLTALLVMYQAAG
ncbi:YdcF family protein [Citricoccus sp. GCM10030269]|uniref:YdcF family protein n=1 Tax=Citricoccus sp. GCM10030269 TaxID=3273388 RepID=UPI00361F1096